ncbi:MULTISPECIES: IDEAL domain-containing protein [Paenibacillus]|uniref:IDEAL domain-containing protein n=1 Tax=Paenibacillus TaxID=44249 RepID=UPI002559DCB1|nr:IDEAL domain-containing protein [Paenibacillus camelliae]
MNIQYEAMLGLTAELILDESLRSYQRDKLQQAIDESLATGNEEQFYELTKKLQQLESS